MNHESLLNSVWLRTVDRLGGAELLEKEARETGAFERARKVKCAVDQLRLVLAYTPSRREVGQDVRLHAHKSARQELTAIAAAALILLDLFQMG